MLLEVSNLTVCFDKAMIINDLSMHVNEGELVSLVGPNGAGKSTLLRAITGLVIWEKGIHRGTTEGDITLEGTVVFEGQSIEQVPAHEITRVAKEAGEFTTLKENAAKKVIQGITSLEEAASEVMV